MSTLAEEQKWHACEMELSHRLEVRQAEQDASAHIMRQELVQAWSNLCFEERAEVPASQQSENAASVVYR